MCHGVGWGAFITRSHTPHLQLFLRELELLASSDLEWPKKIAANSLEHPSGSCLTVRNEPYFNMPYEVCHMKVSDGNSTMCLICNLEVFIYVFINTCTAVSDITHLIIIHMKIKCALIYMYERTCTCIYTYMQTFTAHLKMQKLGN